MSGIGFVGVLISVLGFGSNFVPLKRIEIGDGVFFQFIMCNAIFMTSIPVLIIQNFPKMHGLAILGGFLWCTGNMLCPIAIRFIGMGLGLLVWGCVSMIMGWASGRFGLFGLKKQEVSDPTMNTIGMAIAIVGLLVFLQVKTNDLDGKAKTDAHGEVFHPLVANEGGNSPGLAVTDATLFNDRKISHKNEHTADENDELNLSPNTKRIIGLLCAIVAGIFFGCNFNPAQYVIDHKYDGDDEPLNYVFAHYTGILITSWGYTIIYCLYKMYKGQRPFIPNDVMIPGTISGILWGIAQAFWFFANGSLGFAITFPIISCGPGFIGSLWGIFLFKEISGKRNFMLLGLAAVIMIPALVVVGLSK